MFRILRRIAIVAVSLYAAIGTAGAAEQAREIRVDYAYYSPPSLVLKRFGWLEQEFKADNIPIKWVLLLCQIAFQSDAESMAACCL